MDNVKVFYGNFLKNKDIYNLNVSYWRVKIQKVLDENIKIKDQLITNRNSNGKSFYDGNPIFSYYSSKKGKAIRIIQEDPSEIEKVSEEKQIEAWITDAFIIKSNQKEERIPELVVSLFLTTLAVDKSIELATVWFNGQLSKENLKNHLVF